MDNITDPVVTSVDSQVAIDSTIFGLNMFNVFDPDPGADVALYEFNDFGIEGGFFSINGMAFEPGIWHAVTPADIDILLYNGDDMVSEETFGFRVTDTAGNLSNESFATVETVFADTFNDPVVTALPSLVPTSGSIFALDMFLVADADEDAFVSLYEFMDTGVGGGEFFLNGLSLEAGVWHPVTPAEINQLLYLGAEVPSAETFGVRVTDSAGNLSNESFNIVETLFADTFNDPVVRALSSGGPLSTNLDLLDLIEVTDPDLGSTVATYQIRDNGPGGGAFFLNGQELAPNVFHNIAAFQLPVLSYLTDSVIGTETFTVRVIDAAGNISNTSTSTITSGNSPSVVATTDGRVLPLELTALSNFISVSDIDGDAPVSIGIVDRRANVGGGNFQVRGENLPQGQFAFFSFNELDDILYRGADGGESEEITVIVNDGFSFSQEFTFTITTSSPPVIVSNNATILENEVRLASEFITFSDVDGDTAFSYNIVDRRINEDGGFFQLDGVRQQSGVFFTVNAAQFARLEYVGASNGPQGENIGFQVFDTGGQFSAVTDIAINTETLPGVVANSISIQRDQFVNIATGGIANVSGAQAEGTPFIDFFDLDGDAVDSLFFVDRQANINGGHFLLDGVRLPSATFFSVTPAELVNLEYRAGLFGPQTENLSVIPVSNGQLGEQVDFQIFTLPNQFAPEVNFANASGRLGTTTQLSGLFTVFDQDGDLPVSFSFFDTGDSPDSGFFTNNGVQLAARQFHTFEFSELENIQYTFGSTGGSEVARLVVGDGRSTSQISSSTLTSIDSPEIAVLENSVSIDTIERISVSSFFNQTDLGPAFTQFEILDENSDLRSGRFELNGVSLQQGVLHTLSAAEFNDLVFLGAEADLGRQLDPILIRATNGVTGFTEWERINVNTDPVGAESLRSGTFWNPNADGTTVLTYTFIDGDQDTFANPHPPVPDYYTCFDDPGPSDQFCNVSGEASGLNVNQRESIREALETVSRFANIEFQEVPFTVDAGQAALTFGAADLAGASGVAFLPLEGGVDNAGGFGNVLGDIWFDTDPGQFNPATNFDAGAGSSFRFVALHEIGHALGLEHSFAFSGFASGNQETVLPNASDFQYNTVLSQTAGGNSPFNPFPNENPESPTTHQLYDIVELQRIYGVNLNHNTGNNQYGNFFSGSDPHFVDNQTAHQSTLYDAGGIDTYNYTNHVADETIDLRQGAWSTINGVELSLLTSYLTVIENARGGSGSDTIRGNETRNFLIGNGGDDILRGGGGNDVLRGGVGDDTFIWQLGDGRDNIQEEGGGGVDTLTILDPTGSLNALEDDLVFRRLGNDLRIDLTFNQGEAQGSITINEFADASSQVEVLQITDAFGNQIGGDIDLVSIFDQATTVQTRFEVTAVQNNFGTFSAFAASPV